MLSTRLLRPCEGKGHKPPVENRRKSGFWGHFRGNSNRSDSLYLLDPQGLTSNAPGGIRTSDLRFRKPNKAFVSTCHKTINNARIKTYDADRIATEEQKKHKRAGLLQICCNLRTRINLYLVFSSPATVRFALGSICLPSLTLRLWGGGSVTLGSECR
jgi:hypothetical protein